MQSMVPYPAIGIIKARAAVYNNNNYYYYNYYYSHVSLCRQHQAKQDEVGGGVVLVGSWRELHPLVGHLQSNCGHNPHILGSISP